MRDRQKSGPDGLANRALRRSGLRNSLGKAALQKKEKGRQDGNRQKGDSYGMLSKRQ